MRLWLQRAAASALCLLFAACGGDNPNPVSHHPGRSALPPGAATEALSEAPVQFPAPSELPPSTPPRKSSYLPEDLLREAEDFDPTLPNQLVVADSDGAIFSPSFPAGGDMGGLSFAIYDFSIPEYGGNPDLFYAWRNAPEPVGAAYIAVANWQSGRWEFFRATAAGVQALPHIDQFFDPTGRMVIAVVLTGTQSAELDRLRLGSISPVVQFASTPEIGMVPLSVTLDASGSSDLDGSVVEYIWDPEGDGSFDISTGSESQLEHIYDAAGEFAASVRVLDNAGVYGQGSVSVDVRSQLAIHYGQFNRLESIASLIPMEDGSLLAFGGSTTENFDETQLVATRINLDSTDQFTFMWGGPGQESCSDAVRTADGSIYACGSTDSYGQGGEDALLQKWSADGELLWSRCYGHADSDDFFRSMVVTGDAVFLCGSQELDNTFNLVALIVRTDLDGNLAWTRSVFSPRHAFFKDMHLRPGSAIFDPFVAVGGSFYKSETNEDILYSAYDLNGTMLDSQTWGLADRQETANAISIVGSVIVNIYLSGFTLNSEGFLGRIGEGVVELDTEVGFGLNGIDLLGNRLLFQVSDFDLFADFVYASGVVTFDSALQFQPAQLTGFSSDTFMRSMTSYTDDYLVLSGTHKGGLALGEQASIIVTPSSATWQDLTPSQGQPVLTTTDTHISLSQPQNFEFSNSGFDDLSLLIAEF